MANVGNMVDSVLQRIGDIPDVVRRLGSNYKTKSLIDVTQVARVEPLTIVSRDCLNLDYTGDVMQSLLSIFSGYYLQAVALSSRIDSVRVVRALDRLNPDRQFNDLLLLSQEALVEQVCVSAESFKYRLPTRSNKVALAEEIERATKPRRLAAEASDFLGKVNVEDPDEHDKNRETGGGSVDTKDGIKQVLEISNLSVGKLLNVTMSIDEKQLMIPISVRLSASSMTDTSIVHLLALKKEDNTLVERFHAWRSGRISLIKDLIFCQDLIDEHRRALMNDEAGVYSEIIRRVNNAKKFGIVSGNPSMVSASNIFVISEVVAKELEKAMSGKLSNPRIRQKVFDNTYAMILVVIDREWERVTFYHRGISAETEVSVKDIKSANKGSKGGIEITDVIKSLSSGNAPAF